MSRAPGAHGSGRQVGAMALRDEPSPSTCGGCPWDEVLGGTAGEMVDRALEKSHVHGTGSSGQCPSLGLCRSSWPFFSPALPTTHLRGPPGGGCLFSLTVRPSLLSHFLKPTLLFGTHVVLQADALQSEARFLNSQLESAFSHHWSVFTFHLLCPQPGVAVWPRFQRAPWAPPTSCPFFAERCPCSAGKGTDTQQPMPERRMTPLHVSQGCGLPGLYGDGFAIGKQL